jgi:hypothetical protein
MRENRSKFERLSDDQLIRYGKFVLGILNEYEIRHGNLGYFYKTLNESNPASKKILGPFGGSMSRLDIEYLYYVLNNNDFESDTLDRPRLSIGTYDFKMDETVYRTVTLTGDVDSYCPEDVDPQYLDELKDDGVIDPYDWEIRNTQEHDSDITNSWFD